MKPTAPTLFVLFLCFTHLSAQWQPFPLNQRTYWNTGSELKMYYCDSVLTTATGNEHFFGAKYYSVSTSNQVCTDSIRFLVTGSHITPIQKVAANNNIWQFPLNQSQNIPFRVGANVGESWTIVVQQANFDAIRFTCTHVEEMQILNGAIDSVKVYKVETLLNQNPVASPIQSQEYFLSKRFGLISYIPFEQLLAAQPDVHQLAGCINGSDRIGFTGDFRDFYGHYEPEQIYKYTSEVVVGGRINYLTSRDSIVKVTPTSTSIKIEYYQQRRTIINNTLPFQAPMYDTTFFNGLLTREIFQTDLFSKTPRWFSHIGAYTQITAPIVEGANQDHLFTTLDTTFSSLKTPSLCLFPIVDGDLGRTTYSTKYGLIYQNISSPSGPKRFELIGYKSDTEAWGDYARVSSVQSEFPLQSEITIQPNPVTDLLRLDYPSNLVPENLSYQICNMQGQICGAGTYTSAGVRVSELPNGIYILVINYENKGAARYKMVKQ
jgi:hypothetical protein